MVVKPKKISGAKIRLLPVKSGFFWWLIIGVIILSISWMWNKQVPRISPWNQFGGHSSGFHGRSIKDAYMAPQWGEYAAAKELPIPLLISVPNTSSRLRITFSYRVSSSFHSLWLRVPAQVGADQLLLIDHQVMRQYPLASVSSNGISLFQKLVMFNTVESFLANPPTQALIAADPYLIWWYEQQFGRPSPFVSIDTVTSKPDYVLSTFFRPRIYFDGWQEFSRFIDIDTAKRMENGQVKLEFFSTSPQETIDITQPVVEVL